MEAYHLLVPLEGRRTYGVTHGVGKPPLQVLTHLYAVSIEDQPAVPVGHSLSELLHRLRPCLAVDCLPLRTGRSLNGVAGHVQSVVAAGYAPLAIASFFRHHLYPSPFISSLGSTPKAYASLRMVESLAGRWPSSNLFIVS